MSEKILPNVANKKICILDKSWVLVGILESDGDYYILINGYVVRRWGTTEGIRELAIKGPLPETKLDKIPLKNSIKIN